MVPHKTKKGLVLVQFDHATPDGWAPGQVAGFKPELAAAYVKATYAHYHDPDNPSAPKAEPEGKAKARTPKAEPEGKGGK